MSENLTDGVIWVALTFATACIIDRFVLWLIPRITSARATAIVRRRAGGVNRLVFHGLNTPANCRTPLSTADALITLCPYDVSAVPLRLSVTIPYDTYWSICCYGPNTDNVFAMNDIQARQKVGRNVVFVLHRDSASIVGASNEILVPLKSPCGIALLRTAVPDPNCAHSVSLLKSNQRLACVEVGDSTNI